jgi:ATP-binding cassette subfamily C protein CydC
MKKNSWVLPYLKENRKLIWSVVLLGLLAVLASAALMFASGYLISKSATLPETILLVYVPIVAVRTFGILRAVLRYVERLVSHHVILTILSQMRLRLYQAIEPTILVLHSRLQTGDVLGALSDDIEHLQDVYIKTIFPSIVGCIVYLISVLVLGLFSWSIALIVAVYLFILVFVFPLVSLLVTRAKLVRVKQGRSELYRHLTDAVLGISEWMFSGRQVSFIKQFEEKEEVILEDERKRRSFVHLRNFASQMMVAGLVFILINWAAKQVELGSLEATFIAAFVLVVFPLTEAFLPLGDAVSQLPTYEDSLNRLEGMETQSIPKKKGSIRKEPFVDEKVRIVLEDVSFSYKKEKEVLSDVSFQVEPGEKLVLLGPSGSGKSTILKLIQGVIQPTSGNVRLNGVNSEELVEQIAHVVSVLNQQPHLFDTTILNNIRLGQPEASDEEVYWAAKQVEMYDFIQSLPFGFHTPLHESGFRLSGGQRQRIALARILLQNNPVIILDEPTIGLDPKTEMNLIHQMFNVLKGRTIIFITHHFVGIDDHDQVLFLEKGKIKLAGTHQTLLEENERYQRLQQLV